MQGLVLSHCRQSSTDSILDAFAQSLIEQVRVSLRRCDARVSVCSLSDSGSSTTRRGVPGVRRDRAGGAEDLAAERAAPDVSILVELLAGGSDAETQKVGRHADRRSAERGHDVAGAEIAAERCVG